MDERCFSPRSEIEGSITMLENDSIFPLFLFSFFLFVFIQKNQHVEKHNTRVPGRFRTARLTVFLCGGVKVYYFFFFFLIKYIEHNLFF